MTNLPVLDDLPDPRGAHVLLRADLNVPLRTGRAGRPEVADDFRIRALLPTLEWLLERDAQVTICSHLGRPRGRVDPALSMAPVCQRLKELVPEVLVSGVRVMENLRFDPGEEADDPAFVDQLVRGQDLYVNDAFGAVHRAHASVVGPPARLPSAAGRLLAREVEVLERINEDPARPFVAVVGGAKLTDKLGVLNALSEKVDTLLIGGGMCFTFLAALGHDVGASLVDHGRIDSCRQLLESGHRIVLPSDVVALGPGETGDTAGGPAEVRRFGRDLPVGWRGLDVGPETVAGFADEISRATTVLWNGPMGVFEDKRFGAGTWGIADALANATGFTVAGGGDTTAALRTHGLADRIDHVSTGGGAMLELIEKGDLPGLAALRASGGSRPLGEWRTVTRN